MKAAQLAEKVGTVLKEKARVPVKNGSVLLRQKGVMDVTVVAVPPGSTVIRLDKIGSLSGVRGKFQSRCDFLIVFRSDGKNTVLFIELKKKIGEASKGLEQLRKSLPFLEYFRSLCQVYFDEFRGYIPRNCIHYVLIGERTTLLLDKQKVGNAHGLGSIRHHGIEVRMLVGQRVHFGRLWR